MSATKFTSITCYEVYYRQHNALQNLLSFPRYVIVCMYVCVSEICEHAFKLRAYNYCLTVKDQTLHSEQSAFLININICLQSSLPWSTIRSLVPNKHSSKEAIMSHGRTFPSANSITRTAPRRFNPLEPSWIKACYNVLSLPQRVFASFYMKFCARNSSTYLFSFIYVACRGRTLLISFLQ